MAKIRLIDEEQGVYDFECKGCGMRHAIYTISKNHSNAVWKFNGDVNKPTFSPSINSTWGYMVPNINKEELDYYKKEDMGGKCHFFVRDGQIQFLNDCTHKLKGQTVPMDDVE